MPNCIRIRRKHRQPCIGDLDKLIKLQNRAIKPPDYGSQNFDETFTDNAEIWASVNTSTGKVIFDNVSTDKIVTHEVIIRYDSTVTPETWIEYDSKRLDILAVEDWEERNEWLFLTCSERGSTSKAATKA